jgi:hypothetical protein
MRKGGAEKDNNFQRKGLELSSVSHFVQLETPGHLGILAKPKAIAAAVKWGFGDFYKTEATKPEFENLKN